MDELLHVSGVVVSANWSGVIQYCVCLEYLFGEHHKGNILQGNTFLEHS